MTDRTEVLARYGEIRQWQEDLYREVHARPELAFAEEHTARLVAEALREDGLEVHEGVGGTGVVGVLRNGPGPTVLVRADMDALPVRELTGLPYASTATVMVEGAPVPVMHACGHDVHVACLAGATRLLARSTDSWSGTLVALFQPAEEAGQGASAMVADGLADLIPAPDVALAQHVLAMPAGTVGTHHGAILTSGDNVRITLPGRGGHGAMPHLTVDPAVLAASVVLRLQGIVAREIPPGEFGVLTVGRIMVGSAPNIIADDAVIELTVRAFDDRIREQILTAIDRVVRAECLASGAGEATFETLAQFPLTDNDDAVTDRVAAAFAEHFGDDVRDPGRQTASEDFTIVPRALGCPWTYWGIGGSDPQAFRRAEESGTVQADIPGNHSPLFAPPIDPTLRVGTEAIVVAFLAQLG